MTEEVSNEEERLVGTLRQLEFLHGVADEHLKELAALSTVVDFPEGTVIFRKGEPALRCYVIVSGMVLLEICGPGGCTKILTIGEGELLGWSSAFEAGKLTATARTLTPTRAIELTGREVLELCERIPTFGYQFMRCTAKALASRLTATRLQLLDLYGEEMSHDGGQK